MVGAGGTLFIPFAKSHVNDAVLHGLLVDEGILNDVDLLGYDL